MRARYKIMFNWSFGLIFFYNVSVKSFKTNNHSPSPSPSPSPSIKLHSFSNFLQFIVYSEGPDSKPEDLVDYPVKRKERYFYIKKCFKWLEPFNNWRSSTKNPLKLELILKERICVLWIYLSVNWNFESLSRTEMRQRMLFVQVMLINSSNNIKDDDE